jgi:hypothetical protein
MPLPWLRVGGVVLDAVTANGFAGSGVLTFLACAVMLALVVLPYTFRNRETVLDRPVMYIACWIVAVLGMGNQIVHLLGTEGHTIAPLETPGLWLAVLGMTIVTWGVLELVAERAAAR